MFQKHFRLQGFSPLNSGQLLFQESDYLLAVQSYQLWNIPELIVFFYFFELSVLLFGFSLIYSDTNYNSYSTI